MPYDWRDYVLIAGCIAAGAFALAGVVIWANILCG
jgi:hypothetical protein